MRVIQENRYQVRSTRDQGISWKYQQLIGEGLNTQYYKVSVVVCRHSQRTIMIIGLKMSHDIEFGGKNKP